MFAGKVKVSDTLALVDATYIFFHSSLKYSSCADFDSPLQKKSFGKFPSQRPTMNTWSHSRPLAECMVDMVRYSLSTSKGHSR